MGVKERNLTIRLMEKLKTYPEYARALGIQVIFDRPAKGNEKKGE